MFSAEDIERLKADSFVRTVEHHHEVASTNDLALRRATCEDLDTPLLVLAERQAAGRGRGDNQWWSTSGSLTFSLVHDTREYEPIGTGDPRLCLVTALSLYDALSQFLPPERIRLKWPNDVYVESRKIAGILLERSSAYPNRLVVGVGINANNSLLDAPDHVRRLATSMHDSIGACYPICDVLCAVLNQIALRYQMIAANTLQLADEWRPLCLLRTRLVSVTSGERIITGICHGINDQGALVIQNSSGVHQLWTGVVSNIE